MTEAELRLDKTPLNFGKHMGKTPDEISEIDPSYIVWMYERIQNRPTCSHFLYECCRYDSGKDETDEVY